MSEHLTLYELDALAEAGAPGSSPHLEGCDRCRTELATMLAARDRFRLSVFPRTAPEIERRLTHPWWRPALPFVLAPAVALGLAALGLLLWPRAPNGPDLGIKGGATVRVFAQHAGKVTPVLDGEALEAGDALRFEIQPGGLPYLLVGSVDAAGAAGIIFPANGTESGRIDPVGQFIVPGSAVLDTSAGPERAFVLLSARPLSAEDAKAAMLSVARGGAAGLRTTSALPSVAADAQLSILWEKKAP